MPSKAVVQHECERCKRTWITEPKHPDDRDDPVRVVVRMTEGGQTIIDCSYEVLCDSCKQTVHNLLKALSKDMKKPGAKKSKAKKDEASVDASPSPSQTDPPPVSLEAPAPSSPPAVEAPQAGAASRPPVVRRGSPSGPSMKQ